MRFNDDYDDVDKNKTFTVATVFAVLIIVCVVVIVLLYNSGTLKRKTVIPPVSASVSSSVEENNEFHYESSHLTVSDLDFYELYPKEEETETEQSPETNNEAEVVEDPSMDGKHVKMINRDGSEDWVAINPNFPRNEYDYDNLIKTNSRYRYFEDDRCVSTVGIDVSKDQTYIDFNKVKKAGIDYVMIRLGTRGYQSGQINIDDYYKDNIKRATDAGLEVGVCFVTNAVSVEEAEEEAQFVIDNIGGRTLTYPVCLVMDYIPGDVSRMENVSNKEKTANARAFLNKIKEAGYKPCICSSKEWLIREMDLAKIMADYDFWISDTDNDVIDYPYRYSMWKYTTTASVDGISGYVSLNISFSDYTLR